MTILTKFTPGDTMWYVHPFTGAVISSVVLYIDAHVDSADTITILNFTGFNNLEYYIDDGVAFPTQAELVIAYMAKTALADVGSLILTGFAPTIIVATP